jgi:L-lactate dehydrogenase (cytochrome)
MMFDFIDGGSGCDVAQAKNQSAFHNISLQSRILRNVENISLKTKLLGVEYDVPFGIAPMGMCNLISPQADISLSQEAAARNLPHCVSTAASTTMEQSQKDAKGNCWFQLYAGSDEELTFEMVERAALAGIEHLVFTVDTPHHSRRTRDIENGFSVPLKFGMKQIVDFASHPVWTLRMLMAGAPAPMNFETSASGSKFVRNDSRGASDWAFLKRLRERWHGKLLVKGVNCMEDAIEVKAVGCDAVYVSNHGGRQLDSGRPAIETLPHIRKALGDDFPIVFDSGIRSGDDVVRALACGADFVMIGRPMLFALGADGAKGLAVFLDRLEGDLRSVIAQIGVTDIQSINSDCVAADEG